MVLIRDIPRGAHGCKGRKHSKVGAVGRADKFVDGAYAMAPVEKYLPYCVFGAATTPAARGAGACDRSGKRKGE